MKAILNGAPRKSASWLRNTLTPLLILLVITLSVPLPVQAHGSIQKVSIDAGNNRDGFVSHSPGIENGKRQPVIELPPQASANWWAAVQEDIRLSEYHITWQERSDLLDGGVGYQAPNRSHNLRICFTPQGIQVTPRSGEATGWVWGLSLVGYGYPGDVRPVLPARLTTSANRIEYFRGDITEWYVNDQRGLEQGFVLKSPPPVTEAASQVVLAMKVSGDLQSNTDGSTGNIDFTTGGVSVVRYGDLRVFDAAGRDLPASLAFADGQIDIRIDTGGADYPVTVDPLATSPGWTAEGNQANAEFGISAAGAGDVNGDGYSDVIVGAYKYDNGQTDEGRVYVYHGSASGLSTTSNWTAESNQASAEFGISVASAGDVNGDGYSDVIIGADNFTNGGSVEGKVFVYHGSASGLNSSDNWTAEGNQVGAHFGSSVASAGDVNGDGYSDVIIGAPLYDNGETDEGRAFVYHGSAAGLSASANWTAESNQAGAEFGNAVAGAGDVNGDGYSDVIVGAYLYDNGQTDEGGAFVYNGSALGLSATASWTAESNQAEAHFGNSVSGAGDVNGNGYSDIIVGAPYYDNGQINEGMAFVYHGSASGLSATAGWTAESDQAGAEFGSRVGSAGDVNGDGYSDVIVSAWLYSNGETAEGRAYVYHGAASGLSTAANWTAESNQEDARLYSVAGAGDVNGDGYSDVIIGAPQYDNGQTDEGRAYVFYGSASGLSESTGWTAEGDQAGASFGNSVACAGDVNGDGYSDVIVGANGYDIGQNNEGRAYVYYGSSSSPSTIPNWTAEGDQGSAEFGRSVASAGDVNGDGYSDIIVGASGYSKGRAYVYYGSASGLSTTANWTAESDQDYSGFGNSVASAGDVNGDGYSDVIVGAPYYDDGPTIDEGRAFVYLGSAWGLSNSPRWTAESGRAWSHFGVSVSCAGDVNGDGYSDVIIGAYLWHGSVTNNGKVFVYHGSASGLSTTANWTAEGDQVNANLGVSVAGAGDVNGDGYGDVIIGAYIYSNGESNEGKAFVYYGSASGLSASPAWAAESDQVMAWFGISVAGAGDVNNDGYSDVIVGAQGYDGSQVDEGRAYVYHGSASGLSLTANWTAESYLYDNWFGASVAGAGDVNGDGYSDVIIGAIRYDNSASYAGKAYVYYGNNGGVSLKPGQRKADDSAQIAYLGKSEVGSFRLALLGRTPYGREKVKLEWEVKPLGTPFDGLGTSQSAAWTDTGTAGAAMSESASSLISNTCYHWRLRLLYHSTTVPFQPHSRWITIPVNGWQETDLRLLYSPITLTAVPSSIVADGTSISTLTAIVKDQYGGPVADDTDVVFTTSRGTISNSSPTSNGIATATLTSELSTQIVVADVSATANSFSKTIAVFFAPPSAPPITDNKTETVTGSGTITGTSTGGSITVAGTGPHTVTTAEYGGNPGDDASIFLADSNYYDVHVDNALNLTSMTIQFSPATDSTVIYCWNGTDWVEASDQAYAGDIVTVTVRSDTIPSLTDLSGLFFGSGTSSAPTVINYPATSIMATTAILHGNLTDTGGSATTVAIFSGTDEGTWTRSDNFSVPAAGPFSLGVTGLNPSTTYHYSCYAINASGGNWAPDPPSSFTTQPSLGLWRNYWAGPGQDWHWFSSGGP